MNEAECRADRRAAALQQTNDWKVAGRRVPALPARLEAEEMAEISSSQKKKKRD